MREPEQLAQVLCPKSLANLPQVSLRREIAGLDVRK
jgi:hypothetical protein